MPMTPHYDFLIKLLLIGDSGSLATSPVPPMISECADHLSDNLGRCWKVMSLAQIL